MKTGDNVRVRLACTDWIDGDVEFASSNGKSIVILVDEGIPAPFALRGSKQALIISQQADGRYVEITGDREVWIELKQ